MLLSDQKNIKILIIEDDLVIAQNLKEYLQSFGYSAIKISKNHNETLTILKSFIPDIYLVDIMLKNSTKDGIDIMKEVGSDIQKPIVYLTANTDEDTRNRAKITKPAAYLVKPISEKQLEIAVEFALSTHEADDTPSFVDNCPFISNNDYFFIKHNSVYERINKAEIISLKSDGVYTVIHTLKKEYTHSIHLKEFLDRLKHTPMIRCHNSHAVNSRFIQSFDQDFVYIKAKDQMKSIPIGKVYRKDLMEKMPRL
jgi:DNA-binding LytR/AlgR family response regulator